MQKSSLLLILVGTLIGVGIILSFYGNQVIFENLAKTEGNVRIGEDLKLTVDLDEAINKKGVYAIQIINFKKETISASIYDPIGIEIKSRQIEEEVFEDTFDVISTGTYQLVVKNSDQDEARVFVVMGPEPDAGKKSLGFVSLYILVIGLVGMIGIGVYVIKNRRK